MREVRLNKDEILEKLQENRKNHRKIFEEALEGYRTQVIAILEQRLADAKTGKKINIAFHLQQPEDHTSDYDRVIQMLEMSMDSDIMLDEQSFAQYVQDDWGWKGRFLTTNAHYSSTARDYLESPSK